MDALLISHQSALEYWRYAAAHNVPTFATAQEATTQARKLLRKFDDSTLAHDMAFPYGYSTPLHILTQSNTYQSKHNEFKKHPITTKLPDQSFIRAKNNWLISTPEYTFLQLAKKFSFIELIYLAYELCGTYAIKGEECMASRNFTLTSTQRLIRFLEKNSRMSGSRKALRAAKLALNMSASPMETVVSMLLTMPQKYGGYNLPKPRLNERIEIPAKLRPSINKAYYKCDMYWPEHKIAVEYDSNAFHLGAQKMTEDALRRNDLATLGITVITVTSKQVFKASYLETLAQALAKKLGKRLRYDEIAFARKNAELRDEISRLIHFSPENATSSFLD